jgi:excisionase family DNA binding protein
MKGRVMRPSLVKDIEELPLVLTMRQVQDVLGCAKDLAYRLPHMPGFPSIRFGKTIRVPRDQFFAWLNAQAGREES